ncbi:MAG: UDP-N-acetylglucosamine 2-epimerase [Bdellovibrionales bacterium RIFCSPHIGHO2_01_FULL_40_29]|nr:MAG: UDP-N-acetylglucosamine 2-epimerase [Bdellovibrionales bacterium RIFCSPHIGHO2_01_FULL_40_29]OFZ33714.1 MAG: UDP-N-acetylglucosamine 2-epimerase [Bdellovibrionales bacterium RIFCSPHIGHO2_02_FULL_40_15]
MAQSKFLFVFGTRPESIKMAPLVLEAARRGLDYEVCFTGQHMEMALPILKYFKITPTYNLEIMKPGQSLNDISKALFEKLTEVIAKNRPTHLIVQGDTTTAAVAALIGFYEKIKIVHIEAGLRTYDMQSPWPEEFNRRMIALAADWHFAPTETARDVLLKEGLLESRVFHVGNTGIDALRIVTESSGRAVKPSAEKSNLFRILVTLHRRESFGDEMISVMEALKTVMIQRPNILISWPLHQNPQVKLAFAQVFKNIPLQLQLLEPLGYLEFIAEMEKADLIVTDSGGIQEEAPFLAKPILICRNNTERPEAVACGAAKLVGTNRDRIIKEIEELYERQDSYHQMAQKRIPFGDGYASKKVFDVLLKS